LNGRHGSGYELRTSTTMRTAAALSLALALGLASCAGNESSSPTTTGSTSTTSGPPWTPVADQPLADAPLLTATDGMLEVDLRTAMESIDVSGAQIQAMGYNGMINGPTLALAPGDKLRVTLDNATKEPTNIHYHGLHVSPSGDGDNVMRHFDPGSTNVSEITIPDDHDTGLFWYHAHMHALTDQQVYSGMRGLIVIGDLVGTHLPPEYADITERLLAVNDGYDQGGVMADKANAMTDATIMVNGLATPTWDIAPGETQLWRFANTGSDLFYQLALDGHRFWIVAEDGSPVWRVTEADTVFLPPGKRMEVLVQGGAPGTHTLVSQAIQVGPGSGNAQPEVKVATVEVAGDPVTPLAVPTELRGPRTEDLSTAEVAERREFVFTMQATGTEFAFINGEPFDPDRIDVEPKLGTVEEWVLKNPDTGESTTSADHPFHIHVNDFQVMSIDGKPYEANGLQDIVVIPSGSEVVIRQRFADFTGEFVFHCHILPHEDGGMMQTVNVVEG